MSLLCEIINITLFFTFDFKVLRISSEVFLSKFDVGSSRIKIFEFLYKALAIEILCL